MNKTCEIVQDLLPLYVDDVCSEASREMIRKHLPGCPECAGVLKKLKNDDIEEVLTEEREEVIRQQRKFFKRRSSLAGMILAVIFMIPVLICLIVNLAHGLPLSWFFIVLVSLLLAASLVIVPLMAPKNKGLWTLGLGTASLILLLGVCCIYTGGDWFAIAASAVLFGLAVAFLPFVLCGRALRERLGNQKGLIYMAVVTGLYVVMMICIGFRVSDPSYPGNALAVSIPVAGVFWILFALARYPRWNRLIKAGTCCIVSGAFVFAANTVVMRLAGEMGEWPVFSPGVWDPGTVDGNVKWLCLIIGCVLGIILMIAGLIRRNRK